MPRCFLTAHGRKLNQNSMNTKALEILERSSQTGSEHTDCAEFSIPFELELIGHNTAFVAVCKNSQITLKDLVYPAHQLSDIIIRQAIKNHLFCGNPVKCSAGCMTCCKYAVTVSPAEAYAINDMIGSLPRQSRLSLLRNMTIAGRKILGSFSSVLKSRNLHQMQTSERLAEISHWYYKLNLVCPWLEKKLCSQYSDRPLVCKEFLVTSPPAGCNPNIPGERLVVDLPIKMSEVLMSVCAELTGTKPESIFLPLVPAWCDSFTDLQNRYFDVRQAAKVLVETILAYQQNKTPISTGC